MASSAPRLSSLSARPAWLLVLGGGRDPSIHEARSGPDRKSRASPGNIRARRSCARFSRRGGCRWRCRSSRRRRAHPPVPEPAGDWRELETQCVARLGVTLGDQLIPVSDVAERHKLLFS